MNDNGADLNKEQPQEKQPQLVMTAQIIFINGKPDLKFIRYTNHWQTLASVAAWLNSEITELIVQDKIRQEEINKPRIIPGKHSIIDWLRKKR